MASGSFTSGSYLMEKFKKKVRGTMNIKNEIETSEILINISLQTKCHSFIIIIDNEYKIIHFKCFKFRKTYTVKYY